MEGGLKQFLKSRLMGGGGSKNCAFRRGGVDFFWNNPFGDKTLDPLLFSWKVCLM